MPDAWSTKYEHAATTPRDATPEYATTNSSPVRRLRHAPNCLRRRHLPTSRTTLFDAVTPTTRALMKTCRLSFSTISPGVVCYRRHATEPPRHFIFHGLFQYSVVLSRWLLSLSLLSPYRH
jgi:hypothetical protein